MELTSSPEILPEATIKSNNLFPVVGIGASAGGLDAFKKLLRSIPEHSGMAYVLVQHLDPSHESMLPEILQKITDLPVLVISDDIQVQPNCIYVIPSNKIIIATDGVLRLAPRPAKSKVERNMPIDLFFASLAEVHQSHAIGVVLSGTATDGTLGLKAIKEHGGITFAQDEASAAYEGMPHSAAQAGVVDFILPPEKIPQKILEITTSMRIHAGDEQNLQRANEEVFKQVIALLRLRKGTDFTYYKQTTIRRRILRRMALNKNEDPASYLAYLMETKHEQEALYQDMLIPVTTFFRDPKSFDNLCETVFPQIIANKVAGPIRVWVAGCSTGEEVYSIAICFKELSGDRDQRVQIFATDISEPAIVKARTGVYKKSELEAMSPQRLSDFFTKINGSYQVNKEVRDMCVFAVHNFLKDPPFGKIDFISCRNVLIYMEPYLQKRALTTFHYSLNPKGILLLGKSETTSGVPDLFAAAAKSDKLFMRKDVPGKFLHVASQRIEQVFGTDDLHMKKEIVRTDFQKTADDILLSRYTPAGVVVNDAMDIVHFRGSTANFLGQSPGKPSHNLLKMARHGLEFELRNMLHKAKKENKSVLKDNIPFQLSGNMHNIGIEAIPLPNTIEPYYLILFHDRGVMAGSRQAIGKKKTASGTPEKNDHELLIYQLGEELKQAREDMRSITEDQEATNEELQSANEVLLSGAEELQSLNEELETNKEELQSTNEELTVVNHEIISLNEIVAEARDYSEAIIATIREPLLILDKNLLVKSANKSFYRFFGVKEEETEGKLLYDLGNRQWDIPRLRDLLGGIIPDNAQFRDFELTHNFTGIGEKVMLLNASRIDLKTRQEHLILLAFEDITDRSRYYLKEKYSLTLIEASLVPLVTVDLEGRMMDMNEAMVNITGIPREKLSGTVFLDYFTDQVEAHEVYAEIFASGSVVNAPLSIRSGDDNIIEVLLTGSVYKNEQGKVLGVVVIARDITEQNKTEKELNEAIVMAEMATGIAEHAKLEAEHSEQVAKDAMKAKQQFLSNMSHEIRTPMNAIIGFTKVLLKTDLAAKQKEYLDAIKISGDALIVLINDILDLAKVDAGKMTFEQIPFKLSASLAAMLHLFEVKIQEKNLTLVRNYDPAIPEALLGDPVRLHQIILNLVSNAVKFTLNGTITVGVDLVWEDENKVAIAFSVADTGIGIPEMELDTIFENFHQASGVTARIYGGTGLGLAITKQLVEQQGGKISVTSKEGQGSVFCFTLTFEKSKTLPVANEGPEEVYEANNNIKILVVEDMALNQLLMKTVLDDFGFDRDIAANGKIAIEKMRTNSYDIILMDLQMPEMNGFEATEYIRNSLNSKIPIIALTADVTTVDLAKCKAVGMDDYIAKPIDEKLLYDKIVGLVMKPVSVKSSVVPVAQEKKARCIDLSYLKRRTKSNPQLMMEMIAVYREQTPPLIRLMDQNVIDHDWDALAAAVHKIVPSLSVVGISSDFVTIAKKVLELASSDKKKDLVPAMVAQLGKVCMQACEELKEEYDNISKG